MPIAQGATDIVGLKIEKLRHHRDVINVGTEVDIKGVADIAEIEPQKNAALTPDSPVRVRSFISEPATSNAGSFCNPPKTLRVHCCCRTSLRMPLRP